MRHARRQAMAQQAAKENDKKKPPGHPFFKGVATLLFLAAIGVGIHQALTHPDTPLPSAWNPTKPLRISDPLTPLTQFKLNRAIANGATCFETLGAYSSLQRMTRLEESEVCYIQQRLQLDRVGQTAVNVETSCGIALRLAMWEHHSLRPAARDILGADLTGIDHFGSYSCRRMRTSAGPAERMSTHATASAIDVSGFRFADRPTVRLIDHWTNGSAEAEFLRAARDGACRWFNLTLSPDYNRLHADHFHLQSSGWGLCR